MTRAIWNYVLTQPVTTIETPTGSKAIHVAYQQDQIVVWMEVDPETSVNEVHEFRIYESGVNVDDTAGEEHVGSVLPYSDSVYALHVYEKVNP